MIEPNLSYLSGHKMLNMTKNIFEGDLLTILLHPSYTPMEMQSIYLKAMTRGQKEVVKEINFKSCDIQSMELNTTAGAALYKWTLPLNNGTMLLKSSMFQHMIINKCSLSCPTGTYTLLFQNGTIYENDLINMTPEGVTVDTSSVQFQQIKIRPNYSTSGLFTACS